MRSQSDCVCLFVRVTLVVFRRVFGLYENHAHRISMSRVKYTITNIKLRIMLRIRTCLSREET